jgi:peptide-methionine (S)-S-oxide reductase
MTERREEVVLGGGCFWCTEAIFAQLKGVEEVVPGYAGGKTKEPTYEEVSTGKTGHAEVIKIIYNPQEMAFRQLLTVFFAAHDPTTPNQQGADVGEQYRSLILYTTEKQRQTAEKLIREINEFDEQGAPVVTEVKPLDEFYPAEAEHQEFAAKNPQQGYVQAIINPKLKKIGEEFKELIKTQL